MVLKLFIYLKRFLGETEVQFNIKIKSGSIWKPYWFFCWPINWPFFEGLLSTEWFCGQGKKSHKPLLEPFINIWHSEILYWGSYHLILPPSCFPYPSDHHSIPIRKQPQKQLGSSGPCKCRSNLSWNISFWYEGGGKCLSISFVHILQPNTRPWSLLFGLNVRRSTDWDIQFYWPEILVNKSHYWFVRKI